MTGDDFISFATQLLHSSDSSEAARRTVISRAYYGAFHLARSYLLGLGVRLGREHGDVWKGLGSSGVQIAKQAATQLAVLHQNRVMADYDLNSTKPVNPGFVKDNLERAKKIESLLVVCGREPHRAQIKAGIEAAKRP
jgi:uncharacterized protein (UPF0332 family)